MKYIKEYVIDNLGYIVILLLLMLCVLCSCTKTITETIEIPKTHIEYISKSTTDSIYLKDSIYVNQYIKGDTVYQEKEVIKYRGKSSNRVDTVHITDTVPSPALVQALKEANEQLVNANIEHKQYQEEAEKYIRLLGKLLGLTTLLLLLSNAKRIFNLFKKIF